MKIAKNLKTRLKDPAYEMTMAEFLYTANVSMPDELLEFLLSWKHLKKSPYNNTSYYSAEKSFVHGAYRVSDHWNFFTQGNIHCKTKQSVVNNEKWWVGVYDEKTDTYDLIKWYPKIVRKSSEFLYSKRTCLKPSEEFIEAARKFKKAVLEGKVSILLDNVNRKVVAHGYHNRKRYIKIENRNEKIYLKHDQELTIN